MSGTTTNNGWTYPTSTDLVKDGASAIQTLATGVDTSTGKGLIAWQSYAPTLSNGWLNGNGTWSAYYCQIGKTVHVYGQFTLGSTTTKGATVINISLPVTATSKPNGTWTMRLSVGGTSYVGYGRLINTTNMSIQVFNAAATYLTAVDVTSTVPGTWATSDFFAMQFTYEAA